MAQRAGSADLPLHGGQVPKWLADRMTRLGAVMSEAIVHQYGRDELLRRLAHPSNQTSQTLSYFKPPSALGTYVAGAVEVRVGIFIGANSLPTLNSPERSVSRESEASAKRKDTAEASLTRCWCQSVPKTLTTDSFIIGDGARASWQVPF
jgi:hypothetical protein